MAVSVDLETPRRALAIGAHPDDVEFGCGATLAKWSAAGCEVSHLILTDGSKGTWDPSADLAALVATRRDEQRAAARRLGCTGEQRFLPNVDGDLAAGIAERREVARAIRELRPDAVLGHDPWRRYRLHPDHRAAGFLTVEGLVAARDAHFHPELGLQPHRPTALLLFEADEADHVEAADGWVGDKVAALLEHRTQLETTMGIADPDDRSQVDAFRQRVVDRMAGHGARAGRPGFGLGEAFKLITDV